jgi:hypothetical protein
MPRTQVNCPNCKQPVSADVEQLFDVSADPQAKERLLGGQVNVVACPHCGYQGSLSTPLVYHDGSKEYLFTYFPQELNLPMAEQEKTIGPLIKKVMDNLPQEERKGYLFKPTQMFTFQSLLEKVLEGEGVTKEMIESQKKRMDLLQLLISLSPESLPEIIKKEEELIDAELFSILNRLLEGSVAARDEDSVKKLADLQEAFLEHSNYGKKLKVQVEEIEKARASIEELGEEITREKLLELIEEAADNEIRLNALVSMVRPGFDYVFFQNLSEKIDSSADKQKEKLIKLREDLLEITSNLDKQLEARLQAAQTNLLALLESENPIDLIKQNPAVIDDFLPQVLNQSLAKAEEDGDAEQQKKLKSLLYEIQKLLTPGYNPQLLQELVEAQSDEARASITEAHKEEITPEFIESLSGMMMQLQDSEEKELAEKVRAAYRAALKVSMRKGMGAD